MTDDALLGTLGHTAETKSAEQALNTGSRSVDAWLPHLLSAFSVRRESLGEQLRPIRLCEPLAGLLPGTIVCKVHVLSSSIK